MVSSALLERCCRVLTPSLGRVKFLYADARYRAVRSMCLRGFLLAEVHGFLVLPRLPLQKPQCNVQLRSSRSRSKVFR